MAQKSPPPERPGGNAGASGAEPQARAATPMERFKSLTRRLLDVSREQLAEEERRYKAQRAASEKGGGSIAARGPPKAKRGDA